MHTWSIESAVIRAQSAVAVAVQGVWDKLVAVERVTRPPRLGHDVDVEVDGADLLAEAEAEIDSWEPDELPNPYEPSLSDSELVAVRRLIEPSLFFAAGTAPVARDVIIGSAVETGHDMGARLAAEMFPQYAKSSPAAGARAAGTSGQAVSGATPPAPPACPCTDPPQSTVGAVRGEGGAPDSGIPRPPGAPQPPMFRESLEYLAAEIADAVGDHYDNGSSADPNILWHEAGMPAAIDWTGVATTLLRYFTITTKP